MPSRARVAAGRRPRAPAPGAGPGRRPRAAAGLEHASAGLTHALTTAMPWVVGGFGLCALLCLALPRTALVAGE